MIEDDRPSRYGDTVEVMAAASTVGDEVCILSVASCVSELPSADRERLSALVGHRRRIVAIDAFGFVWLSFEKDGVGADFCLLPGEVGAS